MYNKVLAKFKGYERECQIQEWLKQIKEFGKITSNQGTKAHGQGLDYVKRYIKHKKNKCLDLYYVE